MKTQPKSRDGYFLIFSLMVVLGLTVLTSVTMTRSFQELRAADQLGMTMQAFDLAEAGLDASAQYFAWPHPQGQVVALSGGSYQYTVAPLGNSLYQITGIGRFPAGAQPARQLSTIVRALPNTPFQYAVWGKDRVLMDDNRPSMGETWIKTDSYDSRLGNYDALLDRRGTRNRGHEGDVGTNGHITLDGDGSPPFGILVDGSVITPHPADVEIEGNVVISGRIEAGDATTMLPMPAPSSPCDDAIFSGGRPQILSGARPGEEPRVYCYHDLTVKDGAVLQPDGPVVVIVTGTLHVEGAGTILGDGRPTHHTDLVLALTGTDTALFSEPNVGAPDALYVYGAIYAPETPVRFKGDVEVFGAVIGSDVRLETNSMVHYNVAFRAYQLGLGTQQRTLLLWKES